MTRVTPFLAARVLIPLVATAAVSCVVAPIDYTGKSCPCPAPWTCEAGVCVGSGSTSTASTSSGNCTPRITVTNFRVEWTTPNTVRWAWDSTGVVDDFGSYRFVLGTSEASAMNETGATIFTSAQNPELGKLNLLHTGGIDPVSGTITDRLRPATTYYGKIVAIDNAGCEADSGVLSATTSIAPTGDVPLFVGTIPEGAFPIPGSITVDATCAAGSPCLAYTSNCMGQSICYENIRLDFSLPGSDIQGKMSAGDFANLAYLEMRVATDSSSVPYWSGFRLKTDDFYALEGLTLRADGAFHTWQIPLRILTTSMPLTYDDLVTHGVHEFGVGSDWGDKAHVWVADVHLRW